MSQGQVGAAIGAKSQRPTGGAMSTTWAGSSRGAARSEFLFAERLVFVRRQFFFGARGQFLVRVPPRYPRSRESIQGLWH